MKFMIGRIMSSITFKFVFFFIFQRRTENRQVKRGKVKQRLQCQHRPPLPPACPQAPPKRPTARGASTPTCPRSVAPPPTRNYCSGTPHGACLRGRSCSGTSSSCIRCWGRAPTTSSTPRQRKRLSSQSTASLEKKEVGVGQA